MVEKQSGNHVRETNRLLIVSLIVNDIIKDSLFNTLKLPQQIATELKTYFSMCTS